MGGGWAWLLVEWLSGMRWGSLVDRALEPSPFQAGLERRGVVRGVRPVRGAVWGGWLADGVGGVGGGEGGGGGGTDGGGGEEADEGAFGGDFECVDAGGEGLGDGAVAEDG